MLTKAPGYQPRQETICREPSEIRIDNYREVNLDWEENVSDEDLLRVIEDF